MTPGRDLDAAIAAIWDRNKPLVADRIAAIEAAAAALQDGSAREPAVEEGAREAHKLAGSLGTFGFARGGAIAAELETLLGREDPDAAEIARVSALAAELRGSVDL